jgi:hypothetical protein
VSADRQRPSWYSTAAILASSLVMSLASMGIALHVNAESDRKAEVARVESERKWCSIVITLNDSYREQPPTTATGKNVAAGIAELAKSLDCPPRPAAK